MTVGAKDAIAILSTTQLALLILCKHVIAWHLMLKRLIFAGTLGSELINTWIRKS